MPSAAPSHEELRLNPMSVHSRLPHTSAELCGNACVLLRLGFHPGPGQRKKTYSTWYSQAVTHPSTNQALRCLTAVIGREPVLSTWCGRRQGETGAGLLRSGFLF